MPALRAGTTTTGDIIGADTGIITPMVLYPSRETAAVIGGLCWLYVYRVYHASLQRCPRESSQGIKKSQ
jgi:hypothetical protein